MWGRHVEKWGINRGQGSQGLDQEDIWSMCSDPDTMREDGPRGEMEVFWDGPESGPPAGIWSDRGQRLLGRKGHSSKAALLSESRADDGLELGGYRSHGLR